MLNIVGERTGLEITGFASQFASENQHITNQINIYILSVYSLFSDRVGLSLHNTPFPGVLMSIGATFYDRMPFLTSTTCVGCNIK